MKTTIDYSAAKRDKVASVFAELFLFALLGAVASLAAIGHALAGPIRSVGAMTFVDADTLIVADQRAGRIHVLNLPPTPDTASQAFDLDQLPRTIARALHTRPDKLRFNDIAFQPGRRSAYITVSVNRGLNAPRPALVVIDAAGQVKIVDLRRTLRSSIAITDLPWRDMVNTTKTDTVMNLLLYEDDVAGVRAPTLLWTSGAENSAPTHGNLRAKWARVKRGD